MIGGYPDVSVAVAGHSVDAPVKTVAVILNLCAKSAVPGVRLLDVSEQCALSVKPQIVHLVGKDLQRSRFDEVLLAQGIIAPHHFRLVHDVATHNGSIAVHDDGSVSTFSDGAYLTLGNALGITGIAELIGELLLHVEGNNALLGNIEPIVLVTVDEC